MQGILNVKCDVSVGDRFGELTVIGRPFSVRELPSGKKRTLVVCEDVCGEASIRRVDKIKPWHGDGWSGGTKHEKPKKVKQNKPRVARLRDVWREMNRRCSDPRRPKYPLYGGRGIRVCDEWRADYAAFHRWAFHAGYIEGLQLDRIDNDGGYCPSNCRFVEPKDNIRNSRVVKLDLAKAVAIHAAASIGIDTSIIALHVGVTSATVGCVLAGKTWREAEGIWGGVEGRNENGTGQ